MPIEAFKFKQFSVAQDRCTMKLGTDVVINEIFIKEEGQIYSKDYIKMTKEFYLKF